MNEMNEARLEELQGLQAYTGLSSTCECREQHFGSGSGWHASPHDFNARLTAWRRDVAWNRARVISFRASVEDRNVFDVFEPDGFVVRACDRMGHPVREN